MNDELYHHGILGQKWGVRRFQNKDGSLTETGKKRLQKSNSKLVKKAYGRIGSEKTIRSITKDDSSEEMRKAKDILKKREEIFSKSGYDLNNMSDRNFDRYSDLSDQASQNLEKVGRQYLGKYYDTPIKEISGKQTTIGKVFISQTIRAIDSENRSSRQNKWNSSNSYSKGFLNYMKKEQMRPEDVDDPELIDLLVMEYEDSTGKKAMK